MGFRSMIKSISPPTEHERVWDNMRLSPAGGCHEKLRLTPSTKTEKFEGGPSGAVANEMDPYL